MILKKVILKGFRNFKEAEINFQEKTLVIGSNDVGKSNLLYALRILLDKSLSESDIEPKDSDFYAYELTNKLEISLYLEEIKEDCLKSIFKEHISDHDCSVLKYEASRDGENNKKEYRFLVGKDDKSLEEKNSRFYLKHLNLEYIAGDRDLIRFINKEKKHLIEEAKEIRTEEIVIEDQLKLKAIDKNLDETNKQITDLSYIRNSTENLNNELRELSIHHSSKDLQFDVAPFGFIDKLSLVTKVNNANIEVSGDGRNNQIFLALWAAKKNINPGDEVEVKIYCIEEPEVHLHPHQQRKLAEYLLNKLQGQVFITSHSPQIATSVSPNNIVRLFEKDKNYSIAANKGCSKIIKKSIEDLTYRLNAISAEAFFSDVVFLVEGVSEVLFYKSLAEELNIDLDKLNISILMVDGVGFKPYIEVLKSLNIGFVIRTDNDIYKVPKKVPTCYQAAGVMRASNINNLITKSKINNETIDLFKQLKSSEIPVDLEEKFQEVVRVIESNNIFLADQDLEMDILNSEIGQKYRDFLGKSEEDILKFAKKNKGNTMFQFLQENRNCLSELTESKLALPLKRCEEFITSC